MILTIVPDMDYQHFKDSLNSPTPPVGISDNLLALWYDALGEWEKAHEIVQTTRGYEGDWIHAYLHRKEGDLSNASYWYSRAGKPRPDISLEQEWEALVCHILQVK
jgi:hypothetical protein